jgi:hypothetical protein
VDVTLGGGIIGLEISCGDVGIGITLGFDIVGRKNELMFSRSVNKLVGFEGVGVLAGAVGALAGVGGVFVVGGVGILVGIVGVVIGIVGVVVGIVGILVGIVGIAVTTDGGFIGGDIMPIDRRARPSSGSTEIDAFLRD